MITMQVAEAFIKAFNPTPKEIYDYPVPFMSTRAVFAFVGIDIIPLRDREDHD